MNWDRFNKAIELRENGSISAAVEILRSLLSEAQTKDEEASIKSNIATAFAKLGDWNRAVTTIEETIRAANPQNRDLGVTLEYLRSYYLLGLGGAQNALSAVRRIRLAYGDILATPEHSELSTQCDSVEAFALVHLGRFNEAIPLLSALLQSSFSDQQEVAYYLAVSLASLGENTRSRELFMQASLGPDGAIAQKARENAACLSDGAGGPPYNF